MSLAWDIMATEGLQFFGKMTASISHEIKNTLAIMNENAGLLEDLSILAEKGRPLDLERVKRIAGQVTKQIHRADGLVKRMNRFAHSIDDMIKGIGLGDTLDFVVAVSSRLAAMRGVQLESIPPAQEVTIITFPFFLENLLWLCLDYLTKGMGTGGVVRLGSEQKGNRVEIRLTCSGERKGDLPSFPAESEMALLEALEGTIHPDHQARDLLLTLPLDIKRNDHLHHKQQNASA